MQPMMSKSREIKLVSLVILGNCYRGIPVAYCIVNHEDTDCLVNHEDTETVEIFLGAVKEQLHSLDVR